MKDDEILLRWQNFESLLQFLDGLFSMRQILNRLWQKFMLLG